MPALQMGDGCGGAALARGKTSQLVSFPRGASTSAVVQCAQQACSEAAKRSGGFVAGMTPSLDHRIGGARSPIFASPKTWHRPAGVEVDPHRFQPWRKPRGGDGRPGNGDAALLANINPDNMFPLLLVCGLYVAYMGCCFVSKRTDVARR